MVPVPEPSRLQKITAFIALMAISSGAYAAHPATFVYEGKALEPGNGNGVPNVTHLKFELSGHYPAKGECTKRLTVLRLSDGAYSLKKLLALGFVESADSHVELCADSVTGKLSERLYVNMEQFGGGNLQAAYVWSSYDPKHGKSADTIELYANVEYHVSYTTEPGHLSRQHNN
jgi:hypothetical protein